MPCVRRWTTPVRGDVFELPRPRNATGREQRGERYCVVVQSDDLPFSTWVVCPTSTSARPASWRPTVTINGKGTQVLTEQITAVDPQRLGSVVGLLPLADIQAIDRAIKLVLDLT